MEMLDIRYWTKVYSDVRYNVGLCALQSDIGRSDIRLSPISLITDIGLSEILNTQVRRPCEMDLESLRIRTPYNIGIY